VLQLAQHLRLSKVGTVSIDGTKLQANASKHAAVILEDTEISSGKLTPPPPVRLL
jgi:hypothetical protein